MEDSVMQDIASANTHEHRRHDNVYTYVGQRIKERRKLLKMNQSQLAELMGFSYQQMQKYESGASHISVRKLLQFAKILNVSPPYFYDGAKLDDAIGKSITTDLLHRTRTKPLNVLLVEERSGDVLLFKKALNACSEQAEVHVLHDGELVMDYLRNHDVKYGREKPDIIILETILPRTSGLQLLKAIKRSPSFMEIPVIILTNSISRNDMLEAYSFGAASFIQKSADIKEYTDLIDLTIRYWAKVVVLPNM